MRGLIGFFRPIAARRYDPGVHAIEVQLNEAITGRGEVLLEEP